METNSTSELAATAVEAYKRFIENVRQVANWVGSNPNALAMDAQTTVIKLIALVLQADGKLTTSESDFLNRLFGWQHTPEENLRTLMKQTQGSDQFLTTIPDFYKYAVDHDQRSRFTFHAKTLRLELETILMMVSLSDGEESDEERALIADYLTTLSNHAASSYTPDRIELIEPDPPLPEPTNRGEAPPPISSLLIAQALQAQLNQLPALASKLAADQPNSPPPSKKRPLEELLAQLDQLIGLNKVKQDVRSLINLVKINKLREDRGMPTSQLTLHLVFSGNPGTGKTTVARLLAEIYQSIGILKLGHLVETDRAGLVAGFVGKTALKVREAVTQAIGGVLFIDEAYSLCQGGMQDYGQEAIDTLIKLMEDNRNQLIVIIAGYPDRMQEFLLSNPGMESRFNKFILFEDYQPEELYAIFMKFCTDTGYTYDENCAQLIADHLAWCWQQREANFANARTVRNFYETVVANQANRIAALSNPTETDLATLSPEDLPKAA